MPGSGLCPCYGESKLYEDYMANSTAYYLSLVNAYCIIQITEKSTERRAAKLGSIEENRKRKRHN